jgi:hypothetical protein
MTPILAVIVDIQELAYTVLASIVAATAVTIAVSLAIRGTARYVDHSQNGRVALAYGSLALAGICVLAALAMLGFGLYVMISG